MGGGGVERSEKVFHCPVTWENAGVANAEMFIVDADLNLGRDGLIAVNEGVEDGFETTAVQGILGVRARRPASFAKESWRSSKERKWSA